MPAANQSRIVLGTACMEITREPIASNTAELIPKIAICSVYPIKINSAPNSSSAEYQNWQYRFSKCVIITVEMTDGSSFIFDVQEITNQAGWTANLAGQQQCIVDIKTWLAI